METIKGRITHATKTEAEWNKSTVVLLKGEVGFASDTQVIKVGNGKDLWKNLKSHQGGKGDTGDPLTIKGTTNDSQGNTVVTFSDDTKVTINKGATGDRGVKGDNLTISSTTKDSQGNTVITFSDGTKTTINKGDKGDPLTFDDLTPEQIEQIKAKDVDLSNYATKDDLSKVDVSGQLVDYAKKDDVNNEFVRNVGVNSEGVIVFYRNGQWYRMNEDTSYHRPLAFKGHTHTISDVTGLQGALDGKASLDHTHSDYVTAEELSFVSNAVERLVADVAKKPDSNHKHSIADITNLQTALNSKASASGTDRLERVVALKAEKDHTHDEYLKKGDPIQLTASQKAELKGDRGANGTSIKTWTGTQAEYDRIYNKSSTTLYIIKG